MSKRTIAVNVRVSDTDWTLLQKAAHKLWPGAIVSNAGIILGLARLAAQNCLLPESPKRKKKQGTP